MDMSVAHKFLKRFKEKAGNLLKTAKSGFVGKVKFVNSRLKSIGAWISSESVLNNPYLKYYGAYLVIYGLLLNYTLYILLSYPLGTFNFYTVPAYGIIYYFIKEEITEVVSKNIRIIKGIER